MDAVGLHVQDQPVAVGHLLDAGVLHGVGHPADGREDRVHRDHADRVAGVLVALRRHVADAPLDDHLQLEVGAPAERGQVQLGVQDLDPGRRLDVTRGDLGRTLGLEVRGDRLVHLGAEHDLLEVQDDVGDVLGHLGDRRELVQDAVDPHRARSRRRGSRTAASGAARCRACSRSPAAAARWRTGSAWAMSDSSCDLRVVVTMSMRIPPWRRIIRSYSASRYLPEPRPSGTRSGLASGSESAPSKALRRAVASAAGTRCVAPG